MGKKSLNFAIVHGSWQASDGWLEVAKILKKHGHAVELIDLPGHGDNATTNFFSINLQTYVNHVGQQVQALSEKSPVVLVGHSMAGMVISQVAEYVPVQKLIYIAAFLPVDGECLLDIAKRSKIIGISKNMIINQNTKTISLIKDGLDRLFYHDCSPEVREIALSRIQAEPLLPFYGKVRLSVEKFGKIPKSYVECLKDFSISIDLQRFMHQRWNCEVRQIETGHAPFYSAPKQLAETLIVG